MKTMYTTMNPVPQLRASFAKWTENVLERVLDWVLSKESTRQMIADLLLERQCRNNLRDMMDDRLDDRLDGFEIDVENVSGLNRAIEDSVEEAFNNNAYGIDEHVREVLMNDKDLQEELTNAVMQAIAKKLGG